MKKLIIRSIFLPWLVLLAPNDAVLAGSKNLNIAMILWRGETKAEKGFRDGLKELGYSVQYTRMNAGQDRKELGFLLRKRLKPKLKEFDYIYTFGTTVSKFTKSIIQDQVPHIFHVVADPVGAGIVRSLESSGGNIGGATIGIPLALQIETALKVIKFKRLGLLFNPREKNSMAIRERLYKISKNFNIEIIDLRSPPAKNLLENNLQKLMDKSIIVGAVYLPQDSFIVSNAKLIGSKLRAAKVKSIGSIKAYIDKGALMGVVPDYYELGKAAAKIVDRHQKGEKLQNIPIQTPKKPTLVINKTTSRELNIKIPEELVERAIFIE